MSKKKVCIVLGNGFTIDFLNFYSKSEEHIWEDINPCNLFAHGSDLKWPRNNQPGFLSLKNTPNLWGLGARPYLNAEQTMEIIELVVTSANVYSMKNINSIGEEQTYLLAYKELVSYLKYLFVHYNNQISVIPDNIVEWEWAKLLTKLNNDDTIGEVTIITYNYDIWLERILDKINIDFTVPPMINGLDGTKFKIFKPHGSISFKHETDREMSSFEINYSDLKSDFPAMDIKVKYNDLWTNNMAIFLIPPAGDSNRGNDNLNNCVRGLYEKKLSYYDKNDLFIICGISYWHVDRTEIDALLIGPKNETNIININPSVNKQFESVINSLFKNYIHFNSSKTLKDLVL